ncbi:MAG: ABC transporter ATP-binding protein [Ruminococcaceae bacterium]|nr:ABC transporter ATP-binding protein [Oscillospiraceae bacterium]
MLEVKNLYAGYGNMKIIHDISMKVNYGETVSLLGANGAGKTTLVAAISRLIKTNSGKIIFDGTDITDYSSDKATELGIIQVPEGRKLFSKMTVKENLEMGAYSKRARKDRKKNLEYVYSLFPELINMEKKPAGNLSGGQQQMVAIGRGLMANPKILILDEPSIGLSPIMTENVFEIINSIKKTGVSVLISEQNIEDVLSLADRAYVIQQGSVVLEGTAEEIKNDNNVRKAYLGM